MYDISFPIAFTAGLASFFAPCVLPLLPAYITYITGTTLPDLHKNGVRVFRMRVLLSSICYVVGFTVVFVLMGIISSGVGVYLKEYSLFIQRIVGVFIILFGLEYLGVLRIPLLSRSFQFRLPKRFEHLYLLNAFLLGVVFASIWTPCIGVILGSILAFAAVSQTLVHGALLLFAYSMGIAIPFLVISFTLASSPSYFLYLRKYVGSIAKISGIALIILGLMLVTNTYRYLIL